MESNSTNNFYSSVSQKWIMSKVIQNIPNTIITAILLMIGLLGNSLVLYIYIFKMKKIHKDRFFIPVLAVADLLACSVVSSSYIASNSVSAGFTSDAWCRLSWYGTWATTIASATFLLLIAIYRYRKICKPHSGQMTSFWRKFSVVVTVIWSLIVPLPLFYFVGATQVEDMYMGQNVTGYICYSGKGDYPALQTVYFQFGFALSILDIIVATILYIAIGIVIRRMASKNKNMKSQSLTSRNRSEKDETSKLDDETETSKITDATCGENNSRIEEVNRSGTLHKHNGHKLSGERGRTTIRKKSRSNFNQMFFTIVLFYLISYLPVFIILFIATGDKLFWLQMSAIESNVLHLVQRFNLLNHIVNPFIYTYYDTRYRKTLKKFLRCCFRFR